MNFEVEDLGEKHLKNIFRPVQIFLIFDPEEMLASSSTEHSNMKPICKSIPRENLSPLQKFK
jgi:hypothetical protein